MVAWLLIGPGVLAMLGENDGPSMLSYAVSGSTYGIGFFLPFIAVTFAAACCAADVKSGSMPRSIIACRAMATRVARSVNFRWQKCLE